MKDDKLNVTKNQPLCSASQPFGSAEPTVWVRYLHQKDKLDEHLYELKETTEKAA